MLADRRYCYPLTISDFASAQNIVQQQARFDDFIDGYNEQRPHHALDMRYPAEIYSPSARPYADLDELRYPFHDRTLTVTQCGRICLAERRKINLSTYWLARTSASGRSTSTSGSSASCTTI